MLIYGKSIHIIEDTPTMVRFEKRDRNEAWFDHDCSDKNIKKILGRENDIVSRTQFYDGKYIGSELAYFFREDLKLDELREGNRLLGEFMNLNQGWSYVEEDAAVREHLGLLSGYTKYHKEWNWLMPVVHKLYDTVSEDNQAFAGLEIFELGLPATMDELWKACVAAVKWYNTMNSK